LTTHQKQDHASHTTAPADTQFLPGPVFLLGAPGVGKGTQAQLLVSQFGIPQISTGDLLRANIANGTELGRKAKVLMDQGQLVDDQTVNEMVAQRLQQPDVTRGFVLDGYPRTQQQSNYIETLLGLRPDMTPAESQLAIHLPPVAININVDEAELLRRITGRRTCTLCKHIYNIYSNPPKAEGICDFDGSPLQQRSDDTAPVFRERMSEYHAKTAHVVDYFKHPTKAHLFRNVEGNNSVEQVNTDIIAALRDLRQASNPQPATRN
jgi:adenylate kinase